MTLASLETEKMRQELQDKFPGGLILGGRGDPPFWICHPGKAANDGEWMREAAQVLRESAERDAKASRRTG